MSAISMDKPESVRPRITTQLERKRIAALRKQGHGCQTIGKIIGRDPATVYRQLCNMGIDTAEFKRVKADWSDINLAGAAMAMERRNKIISNLTDEDINAMDGVAKSRAALNLALAAGATIDQAPKLQVNIQFNVEGESKRIQEIEARLAELRAAAPQHVVVDDITDKCIVATTGNGSE